MTRPVPGSRTRYYRAATRVNCFVVRDLGSGTPGAAQCFEDRLVGDPVEEDSPEEGRILGLRFLDLLNHIEWEIVDRQVNGAGCYFRTLIGHWQEA
jgi:hypothetical protein